MVSSDAAGNPIDRALDTRAGRAVEGHIGDVCSVLGIVGAAALVINHRTSQLPIVERIGDAVVTGSLAASGVDTAIQAYDTIQGPDGGEVARGNAKADWGTVAYAATGMIPAASLRALEGLHANPTRGELVALGALAVNGGMLGYEVLRRGKDIVHGKEDASGYGSLFAATGGFVVARSFARL